MGQFPGNRLRAYMPMADLEGKRDFNFQDIRGFKIMNTTGHKVGTVKNVFVDPNTLEPHFAFLDYEKFMNRNVKSFLVPWEELIIGDGYVQTRWAEDELLPETVAEQQANLPDGGGVAQSGAVTTGNTAVQTAGRVDTSAEMSADRDMSPDALSAYDLEAEADYAGSTPHRTEVPG
jgi:sporulation protein YlmC with PRC-barrel domain